MSGMIEGSLGEHFRILPIIASFIFFLICSFWIHKQILSFIILWEHMFHYEKNSEETKENIYIDLNRYSHHLGKQPLRVSAVIWRQGSFFPITFFFPDEASSKGNHQFRFFNIAQVRGFPFVVCWYVSWYPEFKWIFKYAVWIFEICYFITARKKHFTGNIFLHS